jgi:N6-L-threonylcarbamoyladenine synthase
LKTAAINQLDKFWDGKSEKSPENIAASFQRAAVNMLVKRVKSALEETDLKRLSAGGGVAANSYLRQELEALRQGGYEVSFPSSSCVPTTEHDSGLGIPLSGRWHAI